MEDGLDIASNLRIVEDSLPSWKNVLLSEGIHVDASLFDMGNFEV